MLLMGLCSLKSEARGKMDSRYYVYLFSLFREAFEFFPYIYHLR